MRGVAIFGSGGLGRMVLDILRCAGQYRPLAYLDSDPATHRREVDGLPVLGGLESLQRLPALGVSGILIAVGDNHARVELAESVASSGFELIGARHPLAALAPSAAIAEHCIIGARVIVCVNASVAPHSILSAGSIADHDTRVGIGVHIHPAVRLAGGVHVDDLAVIGIGATVIPGVRIGRGAHVHPGSVVIRDVEPEMAVSGIPARQHVASGSRFVPEKRPTRSPIPHPA